MKFLPPRVIHWFKVVLINGLTHDTFKMTKTQKLGCQNSKNTSAKRESVSTFYPFWMHDYYEYLFIIWDAIWKYFLTYHDHVKFSGQKLLKNENNKSATCAIISKLRLRRICWHLQNKVVTVVTVVTVFFIPKIPKGSVQVRIKGNRAGFLLSKRT